MTEAGPRYAIYYAPAKASPLWCFGCSVLGFDADTGQDAAIADGLKSEWPQWSTLINEPRKYGFHATLKAPFRLRDGAREADLLAALALFGAAHRGCVLPGIEVATLGRFVALLPTGNIGPLQALAASVVDAFEPIRAPLSDVDRARRLKSSLTRAQTYYLDQYGYPYVHDEFRFHMTLTGGLPSELIAPVRTHLARIYAAAVPSVPIPVDALTVFRQDNSAARFRIIARQPLL